MSAIKKHWLDFKAIKQAADFAAVLAHYDITAGQGEDYKVLCPFHDDAKPSCSINTKKNVFHCFSCKSKGNILDFVAKMEQDDLRGAAARLNDIMGGSCQNDSQTFHKVQKRASVAHQNESSTYTDITMEDVRENPNKELDFELKLETDHPYLDDRGICSATATLLNIGVATRGMMKGRVCFPIRSPEGAMKGYIGRWASNDIPDDTPRYLAPKNFAKGHELFGIENVPKNVKTLVVVEGFWLAMKLQSQGFPAVAVMGSVLTDAQCELIGEMYDLDLLVFWFDDDDAGKCGEELAFAKLGTKFPCLSFRKKAPEPNFDFGASFKPVFEEGEVLSLLSEWVDPIEAPKVLKRDLAS